MAGVFCCFGSGESGLLQYSACPAVTPGLCLGFLLGPGLSCWSRGLWRTLDVENVSILSQLGLLRGFPRERGEGGVWPAWRGA